MTGWPEAALDAVTMGCGVEDSKRREQAKKQDYGPGFQESKIHLCSGASPPSPLFFRPHCDLRNAH